MGCIGFMTPASALGHQKLTPEAEIPIKVINCDTGYDRDNQSWVLSRLLRDREERRTTELDLPKDGFASLPRDRKSLLGVSFYC
jgi:hypothetical protein